MKKKARELEPGDWVSILLGTLDGRATIISGVVVDCAVQPTLTIGERAVLAFTGIPVPVAVSADREVEVVEHVEIPRP